MPTSDLPRIVTHLDELRDFVASSAADDPRPHDVHPAHRISATNMAHYLALRRRDIRPLQRELAEVGLSSLGQAESHILAGIDLVRDAVASLAGVPTLEDEAVEGFEHPVKKASLLRGLRRWDDPDDDGVDGQNPPQGD